MKPGEIITKEGNITINKDNSYILEFNGATKKRYYPKEHIEKMLLGLKEHPIKIDVTKSCNHRIE